MSEGFFQVSGTLSEDAPSYIERPADSELLKALERNELCLILAPRQTGKSSLMVHALGKLRARGIRPGVVDLQPLGSQQDPKQWFADVIYQLERSLGLETDTLEWWERHKRLGSNQRFMRFLEEVVLAEGITGQGEAGADRVPQRQGTTPQAPEVVIFFDEIDSVLNLPFSDDFFTTLRSFYNARATNKGLKRLGFVLLGLATPSELIKERARTPFNIGALITLSDFRADSVQGFEQVLGEGSHPLIDRIFYWSSGQPYMVQTLAEAAYNAPAQQRSAGTIDRAVEQKFLGGRIELNTHLKFIQDCLLAEASQLRRILGLYRGILTGRSVGNDEQSPAQNRLRLAGVVRVDGQTLRPRNRIYSTVFDRAWTREHTPSDRQRWVTASAALLLLLLWMFLLQPLFFPRFPPLQPIVLYSADPAVEIEIPLNDTNVSRITLQRDDAPAETLYRSGSTLVLSQRESVRHSLGSLAVGEHEHRLTLYGGWPEHSREVPVQVAYYPGWEVRQYPDKRLEGLSPVVEVEENRIVFRDILNGRELGVLEVADTSITATALSVRRDRLLVGSEDGRVRLWELTLVDPGPTQDKRLETKLLQTFQGHLEAITTLAFAADGKIVISGSRDHTLRLWQVQSGDTLRKLSGHHGAVTAIAPAPGGRGLFSAGEDGSLRQWDLLTGQAVNEFKGHEGAVMAVVLSADGKTLVSGGADGTIRVWDPTNGAEIRSWQAHEAAIAGLAFSPDGKSLLSGAVDGAMKRWSLGDSELLQTWDNGDQTIRSLGFLAQGDLMFAQDAGNGVRVWETTSREEVPIFTGHQGFISESTLAFSPDGRRIASGSGDKTLKVWDLKTGTILRAFKQNGTIEGTAFFPDSRRVVSGNYDQKLLLLWDIEATEPLHTFSGYESGPMDVAVSPDGSLAASSNGSSVRIWDVPRRRLMHNLQGHLASVHSVAFSPDGKILASAGLDNTIRLWNVVTGKLIRTIQGNIYINTVVFSPDGNTLVSGDDSNALKLWDTKSGELVRSFDDHTDWVMHVPYSPDGKTLASASDGTVKLWSLATGEVLRNFTGHKGKVMAAAFSPDGRWVASGGYDGVIKIWWAKVQ